MLWRECSVDVVARDQPPNKNKTYTEAVRLIGGMVEDLAGEECHNTRQTR